MPTEKAKELNEKVKLLNTALASGVSPFAALACSLDNDDWLLVIVAFKKLVQDAMEIE